MADLSEQIQTAAAQPASASGPAGSVSAQPLDALIRADQYLAAKQAAASRGNVLGRALRRAKVVPPSALGE